MPIQNMYHMYGYDRTGAAFIGTNKFTHSHTHIWITDTHLYKLVQM